LIYQLGLTFFGLTPEYKKIILDEIFSLCYHSQGGFTHDEAYNMPIRYRRYYLQKLVETHEKQNEEMEKKFGKGNLIDDKSSKSGKLAPPPIPDFAFKARAPKK
jgi:hypothetical protein